MSVGIDDRRPWDPSRFHPLMVRENGRRFLASLFTLPEGQYVLVELARQVAPMCGISESWAVKLLTHATRIGAVHLVEPTERTHVVIRLGRPVTQQLRTIEITHSQLSAAWPDFDWQAWNAAPQEEALR